MRFLKRSILALFAVSIGVLACLHDLTDVEQATTTGATDGIDCSEGNVGCPCDPDVPYCVSQNYCDAEHMVCLPRDPDQDTTNDISSTGEVTDGTTTDIAPTTTEATPTTTDGGSETETSGNTDPSTTDSTPTCGDGQVDPGEECDDGKQTMTCDSDCTFAQCGDDHLNPEALEQCDNGSCTAEQGECVLGICSKDDTKKCNTDIPNPEKQTCSLNCNDQGASGNAAPLQPGFPSPLD